MSTAVKPHVGVLVMDYGTPARFEDIEGFYTDIRRGRPPSPEQLESLQLRYAAIGGVSPLKERTEDQLAALQRGLDTLAPGHYQTFHGSKHVAPTIEDSIREIAALGIASMVGVVLAPHYSAGSVGEYFERARSCGDQLGISSVFLRHWHDEPILVETLADRVTSALASLTGFPPPPPRRVEVVFSAHSLPERVLASGDPYAAQLGETARLVAQIAGLNEAGVNWRIGWQSAGRTPEPWIGPDILELLGELERSLVTDVVVCPAGFTSDHLEILYDLDIEAARRARELGIGFSRTASLNDEPRVLAALAVRLHELACGAGRAAT